MGWSIPWAAKGDRAGKRWNVRRLDRVVTVEGKKIVLCTGASSELTTNRSGCSEMRQSDATVIRKRDIARSELRVRRIETEEEFSRGRTFYYLFISIKYLPFQNDSQLRNLIFKLTLYLKNHLIKTKCFISKWKSGRERERKKEEDSKKGVLS